MKNYVFNSFAMTAIFEDEEGADRVETILKQLFRKKARGFMSVITGGEIYYSTMREQGEEKAAALARRLNARLVTGDAVFQQLQNQVDIEWINKL